jgi:hypothetical protein
MQILFWAAVGLVAALSITAGYYLWQLYQLRRRQQAQLLEQQTALRERRDKVKLSVQRLAMATLDENLTLTEASMRIGVLLDSLPVAPQVREKYRAFFLLAEKTAHIPILEQWKRLSRQEQREFDKQRIAAEQEYGDFVKDAAKLLLSEEL